MSVPSSTIAGILEAYTDRRFRTRNPKTDLLRKRKRDALRSYCSDALCGELVRNFLEAAADRFAHGEMREGRRFYDGAFAFADKPYIRRELLQVCVARAVESFADGDHTAVWRLISIACWYPPDGLDIEALKDAFASAGVLEDELDLPVEDKPLWTTRAYILPSVVPIVA